MRLKILAVGKMKVGPERELYTRYQDRITKSGAALHLAGPELIELPESRLQDSNQRKIEEASKLLQRANQGSRIIVLDERGKDVSSLEFADLIQTEQDNGSSELAFAIGGPDGHGQDMLDASFRKIRFGSMTWPHQIARIMLAEQLYRAITILSGHPYHRE